MKTRHQLPVATPISPWALLRAIRPAMTGLPSHHAVVATSIRYSLGARHVALTDSGTSALVVALRLAVGKGGTVALPGYGCIDLAAAAQFADVRVRLYDLDPATLGPDLQSLERTFCRGVDAVVVAHLYGYPVAMPDVIALAALHGATVIEDAAQAASATLAGKPLGSFGELAVLSFGRGKGTGGASGGALVANDERWVERVAERTRSCGSGVRGWADLSAVAAQMLVGRPSTYGVPLAIPGLRLGQMVYKPAHEPRGMSYAATTILRHALHRSAPERDTRRANAARLDDAASRSPHVARVTAVPNARPGCLRYPVRDLGRREPDAALGVMRGYPLTLHEQSPLRAILHDGEPATPGSDELRDTLFTLPTHSMVSDRDHRGLSEWLAVPDRREA